MKIFISVLLFVIAGQSYAYSGQSYGESKVQATEKTYIKGIDFQIVNDIAFDKSITRPFIIEYFWFGCIHCQNIESHLIKFIDKHDVQLIRKPAPIHNRSILDAKIYYVLKENNKLEYFDELFDIYRQKSKVKDVPNRTDILNFFKSKNISADDISKGMDSQNTIEQLTQTLNEMVKNKINGVPQIVVNGKYLVKRSEQIKNHQDYFELVEYLLTKDSK